MAIRLLKNQTIAGLRCPAGMLVLGLDSSVEARLVQGGDAYPVAVTGSVSISDVRGPTLLFSGGAASSGVRLNRAQNIGGLDCPAGTLCLGLVDRIQTYLSQGGDATIVAVTSSVTLSDMNGPILVIGGAYPIGSGGGTTPTLQLAATPAATGTSGGVYPGFIASATGGVQPYAYSLNANATSAGLTINSSTGVVSGMVGAAATYACSVIVTDAAASTAHVDWSLVVTAAAGFPALSGAPVLIFGDSLSAHEHGNVAIGSVTLTRDGATNLGRITAPLTNSGLYGTPEVQLVNLTDSTMEVYGRNNYQDATNTGISIHTRVADAIATRAPSFNPTTAGTATQTLSNGTIISLGYKSARGTGQNTNTLFGGGIEFIGNLGHPAATCGQMTAELAYAKQILAQYPNPMVFFKGGTNDIKGNITPNNAFAAAKVLLDGLTGLDGNGGNAVVVIGSVPALGSTYAGPATYQVTNEQWIGKCATSADHATLNVDATLYTIGGVAQKTLNRQYYEYSLANPSKVLFVDETTDSYDFANQCMFDAAHTDSRGAPHTADNTHYLSNSAILQGKRRRDKLVAAGVTFPLAIPSSSADATTFNGHTRLANRGPWTTATVSTGFNTGGSGNQPSGWSSGRTSGAATVVCSVTDPGDGLGDWVNLVVTPGAANDIVYCFPWSSSGVTPATLGIAGNDLSEIQLVAEVKWDTATAAGLVQYQLLLTTASGGLYGSASDSSDIEAMGNFPDNLSRAMSTGWLQMSNASLGVLVPQLVLRFGTITGVPVTVSIRRVGINKR